MVRIISGLLWLTAVASLAQADQPAVDAMATSLERLETRLDEQKKWQEQQMALFREQWRTQMQAQANEFEKRIMLQETLQYVLFSLGGLTIIGFGILICKGGRWAAEYAQKKVRLAISDRAGYLTGIIQDADKDRAIRENWAILLLNQDGAPTTQAHLSALGFFSVTTEKLPKENLDRQVFNGLREENYDLVVLDRVSEGMTNQYLAFTRKRALTSFWPEKRQELDRDCVNFANSLMTLYPRLLETAKYLMLLKETPEPA